MTSVQTRARLDVRGQAVDGSGAVGVALGPVPFSPRYGMPTDRFGVTWIAGVLSGS